MSLALLLCLLMPLLQAAVGSSSQAARSESGEANIGALRLNETQAIGTHNSYHQAPAVGVLKLFDSRASKWGYSHRPLQEQLGALRMRQIELDVWADPTGGLFAQDSTIAGGLRSNDPALREPGFKVLHVPDIDARTCCPTLAGCLASVRSWSVANPRHEPVLILIELKQTGIADPANWGMVRPAKIDAAALDALDSEFAAVFPPEAILTPDDVRGDSMTLADAVQNRGWPTVDATRGQVMVLVHGKSSSMYALGHASLRGRLAFLDARLGAPECAMMVINDPINNAAAIASALERGCIVRTRADTDIEDVAAGRVTRRDAALESGAQFVSTDFPEPRVEVDPDYCVRLPGGVAVRANPVTARVSPAVGAGVASGAVQPSVPRVDQGAGKTGAP